MKSPTARYLLLLVATVAIIHPTFASPSPLRLRLRQEENDASAIATSVASNNAAQTSESQPTQTNSRSADATEASTGEVSQSTRTASSTIENAATSIVTASSTPAATGFVLPDNYNGLPLKPRISPAVGIGGAILLISGLAYTLMGVRQQMVQIFLSTTFLASLCVTVLIEYIVKADVSDAIQGAYLVAIVATGLVFGGLTFIFKDMVEGICCLLGGFCLSMWFLTLRAGGLIQSTGGKAGFIAAFTLLGFALSFSHYTRLYGSIGSIAFAGATIAVLGIDCFSRAGYKEFWIYIWNLNDQAIFPLNTTTYPITRGIRVETAIIVLITAFGVISQLKLWRVVKERREQREAVQREEQDRKTRAEIDAHQRYQQQVSAEQARWETVHGEKTDGVVYSESAVSRNDSYFKHSFSKDMQRSGHTSTGSVEMQALRKKADANHPYIMSAGKGVDGHTTVTINVASDDEITPASPHTDTGSPPGSSAVQSTRNSCSEYSNSDDITEESQITNMKNSLRASGPPPPVLIPLPIPIHSRISKESLRSTISPIKELSEDGDSQRNSRRVSAAPGFKRLSNVSLRRTSHQPSDSQEGLIVPHIEDDRRSSIAATLDDLEVDKISLPAWSRPASVISESAEKGPIVDVQEIDVAEAGPIGIDSLETAAKESDAEPSGSQDNAPAAKQNRTSLTPSTNPPPAKAAELPSLSKDQRTSVSGPIDEETNFKADGSVIASPDSDHKSGQVDIMEHAPEPLSKTALLYRTNEWIKHAADADRDGPTDLALQEPGEPGVQIAHGVVESAAPVNVADLSTPALSPSPAPTVSPAPDVPERKARRISTESRRASGHVEIVQQNQTQLLRNSTSSTDLNLLNQMSPAAPAGTLSRNGSMTKIATRGMRSPSAPLLNETLYESPAEDAAERASRVITPMPSNTLLAQRETLIRNKPSSMNFNATASPNLVIPSDSGSVRNMATGSPNPIPDTDDVPLSARKQLLQQRRISEPRQPVVSPAPIQSPPIYDSHQPKRTSGIDYVEQADRMAKWRTSQRQSSFAVHIPAVAHEGRRQAMIQNQRQQQFAQQQQEQAAASREMFFDDMMRRSDMQELHREAMRRMQAKANRNAT